MRLLLVVLLVGCGSVTSSELRTDGGDAADAGAGGSSSNDSGTGGRGGSSPSAGSNGADAGGRGGSSSNAGAGGRGGSSNAGGTGGRGGAAGEPCVGNNEPGFAFNPTCDGGAPASTGCHASCELNGTHYVGCVDKSDAGALGYYCYPSCAACP